MAETSERSLDDLVFVGLNSRVIALDRYDGQIVWTWKSSHGSGFVAVMLDGDRLLASVNGYVTCLEPIFGQEVWSNPLKGLGTGITSLASVRGTTGSSDVARVVEQKRQAAAAAGAAGGAGAAP